MAPLIVRTISRYLLRQHVARSASRWRRLRVDAHPASRQHSPACSEGGCLRVLIAEVFVLSLPFIVAVTLRWRSWWAVLQVFTRLAGDNEITALQAGGVSITRLTAPVLAGATGVALLSFLWNDQLLPAPTTRSARCRWTSRVRKPSLTLKEQVINEVVPGQTFLRASRIDGNTNKLKDVTLYDLSDAERRPHHHGGQRADGHTPRAAGLFLTLQDGDIEE